MVQRSKTTRAGATVLASALAMAIGTPARAQAPDTVLEWNRLLLTTMATPGAASPTVFFTRYLAVVHVAIFDALNSFDRTYTPYVGYVTVPAEASRDAAVAQAARDTLVSLFPSQTASLDAALATQLARIPTEAAVAGARVGAAAAQAVLDARRDDGWSRTPPVVMLPNMPGYWQPTPPANAPATFTHYPDVQPFVIGSATAFTVERPPSLTSRQYAEAFNEVKAIGGTTSTVRTADQTLVAQLYAPIATVTTTSIPALWQNLVRDLVRTHGLSDIAAARLYALVNVTFHDALYVSFSGKFLYNLWRPVTAIREAARDGNADTEADPTFTPLIGTPPYPTYPGNYACLASAIARVLARTFGRDDVPFSITWAQPSGPGITRSYNGFRQLADEAAMSRVYGGIHFRFDTTASFGVCIPMADYVFDNTFRAW